jgi:hypothetical protein
MSQDAYHKVHIPPATKPSGCPVDHEFTPFDADYLQNPYPQLEKLTDEQPTFFSEQLGYLVLTRLEDVLEVFKTRTRCSRSARRPRRFSPPRITIPRR